MAKAPSKQPSKNEGGDKKSPPSKKMDTFQNIIDNAALFNKIEFGGQDIKDMISKGCSNNDLRREVGKRQLERRAQKMVTRKEESVNKKN